MKCLVTGASGFIGSALCPFLEERGVDVMALPGPGVPRLDFKTDNVAPQALAGVDCVIHCAGIAHQRATAADYEQVNYRAVVECAARSAAAGVKRFIFLSSIKAAADGEPYAYWKWRAEQALAQHNGSALSVVILRPCLVYGVGVKANLRALVRAVQAGLPTPPPGGPRSMIGLPDLCQVLWLVMQADEPGSGPYQVSDGEDYDILRLYSALRAAMEKPLPKAWLPRPAWWLACLALDLYRRQGPGQGSYRKLFGSETWSNQALCQSLNWQPAHTFEDLARDIVAGVER